MQQHVSIEKIIELAEKLKPKNFYMNKRTHELLLTKNEFIPESIVINEFIEDGMVLALTDKQIINMNKKYHPDKGPW